MSGNNEDMLLAAKKRLADLIREKEDELLDKGNLPEVGQLKLYALQVLTMRTGGPRDFLNGAKKTVSYWYRQYELILCINMFEPWEKMLLNTFIAAIALMVSYSSYVYLPNYMRSLVNRSLLYMQQHPKVLQKE